MSLPSKYKPELCEKVIPLFKKGMSISEICLKLDLDRSCFYDYIKQYPEFARAVEAGRGFCEGWWDMKARRNLENPKFNANLYNVSMKYRFFLRDKSNEDQMKSIVEQIMDKLHG